VGSDRADALSQVSSQLKRLQLLNELLRQHSWTKLRLNFHRKPRGIFCLYFFVRSEQWQLLDLISEGKFFSTYWSFSFVTNTMPKTWSDQSTSALRLLRSNTVGVLFSDVPLLKMLPQKFHLPIHHQPEVTIFALSHYYPYSPQPSVHEHFVACSPPCNTQHWTPCYVPVWGRCSGICTNRTRKLFFPPAYTELAECSMMTTSLSGPQPHVRRRRSPATQPTCLKRQQLELHCGLQYPVTSQEWPKQHMRRPQCVLHSHSTSN